MFKLNNLELQKVEKMMNQSSTDNLAKHVKLANKIIVKALKDSGVSKAQISKFVANNMYAPAPHDIASEAHKHELFTDGMQRWTAAIDFVAARADKLCNHSAKALN